jgi:hypothetical protein
MDCREEEGMSEGNRFALRCFVFIVALSLFIDMREGGRTASRVLSGAFAGIAFYAAARRGGK